MPRSEFIFSESTVLLLHEVKLTIPRNGLYRKYGALVLGNKVIACSLNHGRCWMLKYHGSECTRFHLLEERDYVFKNPHEAQLKEIFEIACVKYGRIDYSMKNGRIQTWEINLNPTIGRGPGPPSSSEPAELKPLRAVTRQYFYDRFREAWEAVDSPRGVGLVTVTFDRETIVGAVTQEIPKRRFLKTVRDVIRPVKPVIEPMSVPFLRMLGILMRATHDYRN